MMFGIAILVVAAACAYGGYCLGWMDGFERGAFKRLPPEDVQ